MPLSDYPRTTSTQQGQAAFNLTEEQFLGAVDGGFAAVNGDTTSAAYWPSTVNITILETDSGLSFETICRALQAGRNSSDPEAMRSIRYVSPAGTVKFVQLNVEAIEAILTFPLSDLQLVIDSAT